MAGPRRDLRRHLFSVAAEQGGFFSAAQARDVGYSYQAQAHHVAAGNWYRIDRGLFRLAEWIPGERDDLARWTLWSRGQGVVSHETALGVHDIGEFESPRVHLTVPPSFRMSDDAVTLHHDNLRDDDVLTFTGFRVTTPTRAIVDVAATADHDQLARAIEEAVRAGKATVRGLRSLSELLDPQAALAIERALRLADAS